MLNALKNRAGIHRLEGKTKNVQSNKEIVVEFLPYFDVILIVRSYFIKT